RPLFLFGQPGGTEREDGRGRQPGESKIIKKSNSFVWIRFLFFSILKTNSFKYSKLENKL
ncbi:hypothetical protein, partial [uncultured Dubosiella sp.]|uniref:hypothetical protein n=1 Tax=uncultured Dubosiella sp. TaxID=1937011 RepID=UPI0025B33DB2